MFSVFFINRPIFASVLSIIITLAGGIAVFTLPVAQYPEITPPTVEVTATYPGANAASRRRYGRRADRAERQRRREHALHELAVHQRRHVHADRDLSKRSRSEHRSGAGAKSRVARAADYARPGQAARRDREKEIAQRADDRQPVFARQDARQSLPEQLRHDSAQGRTIALARRRRHHLSGPTRLQHAAVARPGKNVLAKSDHLRRGAGDRAAKHAGGGRTNRPAAGPHGPGLSIDHEHHGAAGGPRAICRHDRQDRRRRPCRAGA